MSAFYPYVFSKHVGFFQVGSSDKGPTPARGDLGQEDRGETLVEGSQVSPTGVGEWVDDFSLMAESTADKVRIMTIHSRACVDVQSYSQEEARQVCESISVKV